MRSNVWLNGRLEHIWNTYFPDIQKTNDVVILFGAYSRTRLGSIKMNRKEGSLSRITMTAFFKDEKIPNDIIDLTIAHEICHYAHGFSSPLPQLFKYPHQGNIVDRELIKRGLGDQLDFQKKWLKTNWKHIVGPAKRRVMRKRRKIGILDLLFS